MELPNSGSLVNKSDHRSPHIKAFWLSIVVGSVALCVALLPQHAQAVSTPLVGLAYAGDSLGDHAAQSEYLSYLLGSTYLAPSGLSATYAGAWQMAPIDTLTVEGIDAWAHRTLPRGVLWIVLVHGGVINVTTEQCPDCRVPTGAPATTSCCSLTGYHVKGDLPYSVVSFAWSPPSWQTVMSHELVEMLATAAGREPTEIADGCASVPVEPDSHGWLFVAYEVEGQCMTFQPGTTKEQ